MQTGSLRAESGVGCFVIIACVLPSYRHSLQRDCLHKSAW